MGVTSCSTGLSVSCSARTLCENRNSKLPCPALNGLQHYVSSITPEIPRYWQTQPLYCNVEASSTGLCITSGKVASREHATSTNDRLTSGQDSRGFLAYLLCWKHDLEIKSTPKVDNLEKVNKQGWLLTSGSLRWHIHCKPHRESTSRPSAGMNTSS